jgi:hypothetical protein
MYIYVYIVCVYPRGWEERSRREMPEMGFREGREREMGREMWRETSWVWVEALKLCVCVRESVHV